MMVSADQHAFRGRAWGTADALTARPQQNELSCAASLRLCFPTCWCLQTACLCWACLGVLCTHVLRRQAATVLRSTHRCRLFIMLNLSLSLKTVHLLCRCRQGPLWCCTQQAHACHQLRAGQAQYPVHLAALQGGAGERAHAAHSCAAPRRHPRLCLLLSAAAGSPRPPCLLACQGPTCRGAAAQLKRLWLHMHALPWTSASSVQA